MREALDLPPELDDLFEAARADVLTALGRSASKALKQPHESPSYRELKEHYLEQRAALLEAIEGFYEAQLVVRMLHRITLYLTGTDDREPRDGDTEVRLIGHILLGHINAADVAHIDWTSRYRVVVDAIATVGTSAIEVAGRAAITLGCDANNLAITLACIMNATPMRGDPTPLVLRLEALQKQRRCLRFLIEAIREIKSLTCNHSAVRESIADALRALEGAC